jgi:hypothetical protein
MRRLKETISSTGRTEESTSAKNLFRCLVTISLVSALATSRAGATGLALYLEST